MRSGTDMLSAMAELHIDLSVAFQRLNEALERHRDLLAKVGQWIILYQAFAPAESPILDDQSNGSIN